MTTATDDTGLTVAYARPCDVIRQFGTRSLDYAEHARAARISNKARHDHFIAGRALLRHRLSDVVEHTVQPASWYIVGGLYGKPSVAPGLPQIHFGISHAEGLVAVATSPAAEIGIDLEQVTDARDTSPALDQLTSREQAWLQRHSDADRWPAFLQLWTAKEAVSKAAGLGCGVDFRDIDIDVPAGRARCPDGLSATGDHIEIDLQTIQAHDTTYCLSVACM